VPETGRLSRCSKKCRTRTCRGSIVTDSSARVASLALFPSGAGLMLTSGSAADDRYTALRLCGDVPARVRFYR